MESKYLKVSNIPVLGVIQELLKLFALYGPIETYHMLDEDNADPYTDMMSIKFCDLPAARVAKKQLNKKAFYNHPLKVEYTPELESLEETQQKLDTRREEIQFLLDPKNQQELYRPTPKKDPWIESLDPSLYINKTRDPNYPDIVINPKALKNIIDDPFEGEGQSQEVPSNVHQDVAVRGREELSYPVKAGRDKGMKRKIHFNVKDNKPQSEEKGDQLDTLQYKQGDKEDVKQKEKEEKQYKQKEKSLPPKELEGRDTKRENIETKKKVDPPKVAMQKRLPKQPVSAYSDILTPSMSLTVIKIREKLNSSTKPPSAVRNDTKPPQKRQRKE
uniref:RRM domain-containing protein n=1 Tax=Arcella intermedia TaxID=1963864 RepID=A0A6B2L8D8_9EUKA